MQQEKLDRLQKKEEEETLKEEPPRPPPQPIAEPVLAAEPLTAAAVVAANAPLQDDAPPPVLSPEVVGPVTALCMLCLHRDVVQVLHLQFCAQIMWHWARIVLLSFLEHSKGGKDRGLQSPGILESCLPLQHLGPTCSNKQVIVPTGLRYML